MSGRGDGPRGPSPRHRSQPCRSTPTSSSEAPWWASWSGMTGAGGGALMTPMLILFFGVKPSTAISSDLVAAVLMRPVGAVVHMTKKTVNYSLVGWMVLGSVPSALLGAYVLHLLGNSDGAENNVQIFLGAALLLGAFAMVLRYGLDRRSGQSRHGLIGQVVVRPLPTVAIGVLGRLRRRHDVRRLGLADDRAAALPVPGARRQPARRHRPHPGRPADAGGRARRAGLRPRRVRRDDLHRVGERAGRARRLADLLAGARPLHPPGDHVRDLRVRAQVRRASAPPRWAGRSAPCWSASACRLARLRPPRRAGLDVSAAGAPEAACRSSGRQHSA